MHTSLRSWLVLLSGIFMLSLSFTALAGATAISSNRDHSCLLTDLGGVVCWGSNDYGQLGNDWSYGYSSSGVSGLSSGVKAIATGHLHTCALTISGAVKCWGDNRFSQLGDGTTPPDHVSKQYDDYRSAPVTVVGLTSGIKAIAAGSLHSCAVTNSGVVKCWGQNSVVSRYGGFLPSNVPVAVKNLSGVKAIAAGEDFTCALTTAGAVKCWGENNEYGQLGNGSKKEAVTPVSVSGLASGVVAIDAGANHVCALTSGGAIKCWGNNEDGQLGDGSRTNRLKPVSVKGLTSGVKAIDSGENASCALLNTNEVKCWGESQSSIIFDDNEHVTEQLTPVVISGFLSSDVVAISVGGDERCLLTGSGDVQCWASNWTKSYDSYVEGITNYWIEGLTEITFSGYNPFYDHNYEIQTLTLSSLPAFDGSVLESAQSSKKGGVVDAKSTAFSVGDSAKNQQNRGILHFDTTAIPDSARILKATLILKKQSSKGSVNSLGNIVVDMHRGYYGTGLSLAANDFQAGGGKKSIGMFSPSGSIYVAELKKEAIWDLNNNYPTQFKLRFPREFNGNKAEDVIRFYSGNASDESVRPKLVITYY